MKRTHHRVWTLRAINQVQLCRETSSDVAKTSRYIWITWIGVGPTNPSLRMEKGRSSSCLRAHRLNKLIIDYPLNLTTEMGEPRFFCYDKPTLQTRNNNNNNNNNNGKWWTNTMFQDKVSHPKLMSMESAVKAFPTTSTELSTVSKNYSFGRNSKRPAWIVPIHRWWICPRWGPNPSPPRLSSVNFDGMDTKPRCAIGGSICNRISGFITSSTIWEATARTFQPFWHAAAKGPMLTLCWHRV